MRAPCPAVKLQPRRLTESHRAGAIHAVVLQRHCGSIQNALLRWRIVNPAEAAIVLDDVIAGLDPAIHLA